MSDLLYLFVKICLIGNDALVSHAGVFAIETLEKEGFLRKSSISSNMCKPTEFHASFFPFWYS